VEVKLKKNQQFFLIFCSGNGRQSDLLLWEFGIPHFSKRFKILKPDYSDIALVCPFPSLIINVLHFIVRLIVIDMKEASRVVGAQVINGID
jgi:hypothetical protein